MDYMAFPPFVYRLIALNGRRIMGPDEIAKRSGLSRSTVQRISSRPWKNVRIGAYLSFIDGCVGGVSPKVVKQRIMVLQEKGITGLKYLNPSIKKPLFQRGAAGNTRKFLIKIISNQ